ncbi:MAG: DNA translocase FtsK 4TM domain-containing protein [Phycisphaerae bacterium]|nr:DNA translocase FtsK 4TM domain-containing protein [Phycisphaerae bacterium]
MVSKHRDKPTPHSHSHWRAARYCGVLLLSGLVILSWLSLLSYSPTDPPSPAVYPPPRPANAAGIVGAYLAHVLRYWLGGGVYMGLAFASVAAFILVLGGRITRMPWRVLGVAVLVAAASTAVSFLKPVAAQGAMVGPAGVLGTAAGRFLLSRFAQAGAWVIVLVSFCVGLLLSAENLVLQIPRLGRKVWNNRGQLPAVVDVIRSAIPNGKAEPSAAAKDRTPAPVARPLARPAAPPPRPAVPMRPLPPPVARVAAKPPTLPAKPTPGKIARGQDGKEYVLPSPDLLAEPTANYIEMQESRAAENRAILQQTLSDFGVGAEVVGHMTGPVITMFELTLAPGVKVSQVSNLATDIARALAVPGVRVVSPLPGKDTIGIEVPNLQKEIVRIRELMHAAPDAEKTMHLPLYLGKDASGSAIVADLASMPHMLIAGTTGSGKSVCINAILLATLMTRTPEQVRLILIDPKMVEMASFEDVPHLLCPIVNDIRRAEDILEWAAVKMDERYELFKETGVKNVTGYNRLSAEEIYQRLGAAGEDERAQIPTHLPYYVIVIDELADLIMTSRKEVETYIIRLAQKARAVGIHMLLATQRPSADVVTSLIKANMPCRISFRVASRLESRIVLDQNGAEVLLGQGDMLFLQPGTSSLIRAQGTYVDEEEIRTVVGALRKGSEPHYSTELMRLGAAPLDGSDGERDELFDQGVEIVLSTQRGSVSLLQRRLQIGYSRASRIIDQMAEAGLLGDYKGSQARECLVTLDDWYAMKAAVAADTRGDSALDGEPTSV